MYLQKAGNPVEMLNLIYIKAFQGFKITESDQKSSENIKTITHLHCLLFIFT